MSAKLKAKLREKGAAGQLRQAGFVPGVVYGHGVKNVNVSVVRAELFNVLRNAGESSLVELEVAGDKTRHVLVHETQLDPMKNTLSHVDFLEVRLDQKVKAEVPVVFVGESPAVKELGGVLIKNVQHLEVEALPQDLPHSIEVDISAIKMFNDHIKVLDIKLSSNVKLMAEAGSIIASVVPPRSEAELEELKQEVVEDVSKVEGVVKPEKVEESETKEIKGKEKEEKGEKK